MQTGQLSEKEIREHFPFQHGPGEMITENQLRKALKQDMMREVVLAAGNQLDEIPEEVENEDWEDQIAQRNRQTTRF